MSSTSSGAYKLLVLISGTGTNLQALIDACKASQSSPQTTADQVRPPPTLPANTSIIRVISNRKDAKGLQRAQDANIPTTYHNLVSYKKKHPKTDDGVQAAREAYDIDLANLILANSPDLVVCAGFMHILSPAFLAPLSHIPIINLHPALPGQFNGIDAISRAWHAFQRGEIAGTGVMIHRVVAEVDMGEPVVVKQVEMRHGESESELKQRLHEVEWVAIVEGTRKALEEIGRQRSGVEGASAG